MAQELLDINNLVSLCINHSISIGRSNISETKVMYTHIKNVHGFNAQAALSKTPGIDFGTVNAEKAYNNKMHLVTDMRFYVGENHEIYCTMSVIFDNRKEQLEVSIYTLHK